MDSPTIFEEEHPGKGCLLWCLFMSPKSWCEERPEVLCLDNWVKSTKQKPTHVALPALGSGSWPGSCERFLFGEHSSCVAPTPREPQKGILQGWSTNSYGGRKERMVSQDPSRDPHQIGPVDYILKWSKSGDTHVRPQAPEALPADLPYPKLYAEPFILKPIQSF